MAKAYSVASWNVEHFGALDKRTKEPIRDIDPVIAYLSAQDADVVAVYEVRSEYVFRPIAQAMPEYQFHITEGPQMQEVLIGVRNGLTGFVTQRTDFKAGQSTLRPGVILTLLIDDAYYPMLFLHLKSMTDPKGFGLRDDMIKRAFKFRKTLNDKAANGRANYLFLGDLNTMGLDYPYTAHDISGDDEIHELERRAGYRDMVRLPKTSEISWWNGKDEYKPGSKLDHVVAAKHLRFKEFNGIPVDVRGWVEFDTEEEQKEWIEKYSDHCLLYFEVQKV